MSSNFIKTIDNISSLGGSSDITVAGKMTTLNSFTSPSSIDVLNSCAYTATTFDFNTGLNWVLTAPTATQTPAQISFNNLPTNSNQSYTFVLIIPNTSTAYYINPTAIKINTSTTATLKSNIGTLSTASNFIIQSFTCMNIAGSWYVLTSASSF